MKPFIVAIKLAGLMLAVACSIFWSANTMAQAINGDAKSPASPTARDGSHDFDFEFGEWRVHHRVKRAGEGVQWAEFEGTCTDRPLMQGIANIEEHIFNKPSGISYGVAMRAYDAPSRQWAIWWIDSRDPHAALDPPMKGRFENKVGTFYSDGMLNGKPMRVRFIWSDITPSSARWEQAYSFDGEKTWEVNWIMEFKRTG